MPITPSPAVLRAGDVLRHLAHHPSRSFTVSELARRLDIPRATCDAVLQALAELRLVIRDDDRRYRLGVGCIALGDAARIANPVLRAACVRAEELARATSSCTSVSVRDGDESRVVEVFDHGPPFGLRAHVGQSIPFVPPFGAVYVAWREDDAEAWLARADTSLEPDQRDRYRRALDAVRRRGYSVSVTTPRRPELAHALETLAADPDADQARRTRDELIRELSHGEYLASDLEAAAVTRVSQMSAPVFDHTGRAVASILVVGPDYEMTGSELHALAAQLVKAAGAATDDAGGRPTAAHA